MFTIRRYSPKIFVFHIEYKYSCRVFLYFYVSYLLQIEAAASGALDTAKSALGGGGDKRRRKRHGDDDEDDDKYACGKLLLFGTAYRSCVRKVAITREGKATIVCHYLVLDFPILLGLYPGHIYLAFLSGEKTNVLEMASMASCIHLFDERIFIFSVTLL